MKRHHRKGQKKALKPSVMPGFDYGIDRSTAVITAPIFNDQMRNADIVACAYGQIAAPGVARAIPCISIVARNPGPLKEAFQQFHGWIEATGPDALKVEILYSRDGYYIALGPDYQHAMWRTVGIDQFTSPTFFGITYIKTLHTRHPFLDDLAEYSRQPFAPVMLLGAHYTGSDPQEPATTDLKEIKDCPALLLHNLPIYQTNEEMPQFSSLQIMVSKPTKEDLAQSREQLNERDTSPEGLSTTRERRLTSLMPVTLHMLRNYPLLLPKLAVLEECGVARWQIEQAIVNQRLWSQVSASQRARIQNANDLYRSIDQFTELDTPDWDAVADDQEAILEQVLRDARMLLKKIGASASNSLEECQKELAARGYVRSRNAS